VTIACTIIAGFEVITAVLTKSSIFWNIELQSKLRRSMSLKVAAYLMLILVWLILQP
jgi:hypothetical protein